MNDRDARASAAQMDTRTGGTGHPPQRIAVLVPVNSRFGRGLLKGASAYAQGLRRWHFQFGVGPTGSLAALRALQPHGILALAPTVSFARRLSRCGVPVVNCSGNAPGVGLATVRIDNSAIGQMAGEYFLARGFRHFAFCGRPRRLPLTERGRAFREVVSASGGTYDEFVRWPMSVSNDHAEDWSLLRHGVALLRWLEQLPKPVAIFTSDDLVAAQVNEYCAVGGIEVPDEAAILGVDNDDVICQAAYPALSSVSLPHHEMGYAAAAALDRLMRGEPITPHEQLFEPTEVVTRASTDIIAVSDECVSQALRFIREHADVAIGVEEVAEAAAVSRRVLEMRFRQTLGRTVLKEIQKAHVHQARRLLRETDWPIEEVAMASGFNGRERFSVVFRKLTQETPAQYRRRFLRMN